MSATCLASSSCDSSLGCIRLRVSTTDWSLTSQEMFSWIFFLVASLVRKSFRIDIVEMLSDLKVPIPLKIWLIYYWVNKNLVLPWNIHRWGWCQERLKWRWWWQCHPLEPCHSLQADRMTPRSVSLPRRTVPSMWEHCDSSLDHRCESSCVNWKLKAVINIKLHKAYYTLQLLHWLYFQNNHLFIYLF